MNLMLTRLFALGAAFEEALQEPFKGYCAKAPDAQRMAVPEPPPAHVLQDAKLELRGVQFVFRHGARDLSSDKQCFEPMQCPGNACSKCY